MGVSKRKRASWKLRVVDEGEVVKNKNMLRGGQQSSSAVETYSGEKLLGTRLIYMFFVVISSNEDALTIFS